MIKWDIYSELPEEKAIQERKRRTKENQSLDEYKEFDKQMSTGNFHRKFLTEEAKGGVLFLTDKVDRKTLLDVLHERHPGTCKAIMS